MVPNLQSGGRGTAKGYSNRGVKAQQGQADEPSLRRRWIGSGSGYQEAGGPAGRGKRGGRVQGLWKVVKFQLHDFHALPEYLRDNEFIHRHYRVHWPLKESALSIFSIHNETLNIWTHLAGFWMFSWLTLYTLMKLPEIKDQLPSMMAYLHTWSSELMPLVYKILPTVVSTCLNPDAPNRPELCVLQTLPSRRTPRWPFFVFLGGAMFGLLASAMCHLFFCHSPWTSYFLLQIDYAGIVGLIVSSFYPPRFMVYVACRYTMVSCATIHCVIYTWWQSQ